MAKTITNEVVEEVGKLDELKVIHGARKNFYGMPSVELDFSLCTSKTDVTGAEMTDLNVLVQKYGPNELANYLAQRAMGRQEINNHDFSKEPDKQGAMNEQVRLNKAFEALDPEIKKKFSGTLEFLKFIDNPQNLQKIRELGLITAEQIQELKPEPLTKPAADVESK